MRFLVDAHLPPALARWLTDRGHRAEHVADLGLAAASDSVIWDFAASVQAIIVTKDEDFARRRRMSGAGPVVLWLRVPNTRRRAMLVWFENVLDDVLLALERGETLVEVR